MRGVLLPQARKGLVALGVDEDVAKHYLGIIAERARTRRNGALWQLRTLSGTSPHITRPDSPERAKGLAELVNDYYDNQLTGKPVHQWKVHNRR